LAATRQMIMACDGHCHVVTVEEPDMVPANSMTKGSSL